MGYYWISDDDYTDRNAVFADLETKLTGLYGEPTDVPKTYHTTKKWQDSSGNTIILTAYDSYGSLRDTLFLFFFSSFVKQNFPATAFFIFGFVSNTLLVYGNRQMTGRQQFS